jgi:hypothetical protein
MPPHPTCLQGIVFNYVIEHRDNITFFTSCENLERKAGIAPLILILGTRRTCMPRSLYFGWRKPRYKAQRNTGRPQSWSQHCEEENLLSLMGFKPPFLCHPARSQVTTYRTYQIKCDSHCYRLACGQDLSCPMHAVACGVTLSSIDTISRCIIVRGFVIFTLFLRGFLSVLLHSRQEKEPMFFFLSVCFVSSTYIPKFEETFIWKTEYPKFNYFVLCPFWLFDF